MFDTTDIIPTLYYIPCMCLQKFNEQIGLKKPLKQLYQLTHGNLGNKRHSNGGKQKARKLNMLQC